MTCTEIYKEYCIKIHNSVDCIHMQLMQYIRTYLPAPKVMPAAGVAEDAVEVPANGVEKPSVPLDALEDNGIPARKHDTALKYIKGTATKYNKYNAFCYLRCTAFRLLTCTESQACPCGYRGHC